MKWWLITNILMLFIGFDYEFTSYFRMNRLAIFVKNHIQMRKKWKYSLVFLEIFLVLFFPKFCHKNYIRLMAVFYFLKISTNKKSSFS